MKTRLLLLMILGTSIVKGQVFEWATHVTTEDGTSEAIAVTTDNEDAVYSLGLFGDYQDFDPSEDEFIMTAPDSEKSGFVQKLDKNGNFEWAIQLDNDELELSGIVTSSDNKVYIFGHFEHTIDLDPSDAEFIVETWPSRKDMFLLCLDQNGNFLWGQGIGELSTHETSRAIAIDQDDNIYISGPYEGKSIIIKYNSTGTELWRYVAIDGGYNTRQLAVNNDNDLIVTGLFWDDTLDIDVSDDVYEIYGHTGLSNSDFVMNLNSEGDFQWAVSIGGEGSLWMQDIAIDQSNNIYMVGGFFSGDIDVDPSESEEIITAGFEPDGFVLKLSETGSFEWVGTCGTEPYEDMVYGVHIDNEQVYLTGSFYSSVDFDFSATEHVLTSNGQRDVFVQVLGLDGEFKWVQNTGAGQNDIGYDITVDQDGSIYTVGKFQNEVDFDPSDSEFILESLDGTDAFVQKLNTSLGTTEIAKESSMRVYPNPCHGSLYIINNDQEQISIEIYDILGTLRLTESFGSQTHEINMTSFSEGLYLVVIKDRKGNISSKKIIKN